MSALTDDLRRYTPAKLRALTATPGEVARLRRLLLAACEALDHPVRAPRKHWTTVLGTPSNWAHLGTETQRLWVEGAFTRARDRLIGNNQPGNEREAARQEIAQARLEALAQVGRPLDAE